jgi:hypothetical protein
MKKFFIGKFIFLLSVLMNSVCNTQVKAGISSETETKPDINQVNQQNPVDSSRKKVSGLKITDMNHTSIEQAEEHSDSLKPAPGAESITPEQRQELMDSIKKIKENDDANKQELERLLHDQDD